MRRVSVALLVALAVAGCKKAEPPPPPGQAQQNVGAQGAPGAAASVTGKVLERLDAPPYSYLKLQTAQGESWAAVPKTEVAQGAEVTVTGAIPMQNFESKTLNRTFEVVFFGTLGGQGGQAAAPAMQMPPAMGGAPQPMEPAQMAAQHAAAAAGPAEVGDVKVAKATAADGRTVSEVWAQREKLKEKSVSIRGKVVKYNENIMGKNWLHLRDGTGTSGKDNDITVTTPDKAAVGDVVTAKGTVRVDKDFGSGYAYPVIVEDAKISK